MVFNRLRLGLGLLAAVGLTIAACGDGASDGDPVAAPDQRDGACATPEKDAASSDADARGEGGADRDARAEVDAEVDAGLDPGVVTDLTAIALTHGKIGLTWTAPPGSKDAGPIVYYDIRYAKSPITSEAEFLAATALETASSGEPPGTTQTWTLDNLTPETQYYVALRAEFEDESDGPISNVVTATTKPVASFLVSEVAFANTVATGGDFVELIATKAGSAAEIKVTAGAELAVDLSIGHLPLYTFGALDVAAGDRVVIHVTGMPAASGFVQEDTTNSKTSSTEPFASNVAYDVYSDTADLAGMGMIGVVFGPLNSEVYQDAVAYSDQSTAYADQVLHRAIVGFLGMSAHNQWSFSRTTIQEWGAVDESSLCEALVETVNASGSAAGECGLPAAGMVEGRSLQRDGTNDTNTPADFEIAPQTRGGPKPAK